MFRSIAGLILATSAGIAIAHPHAGDIQPNSAQDELAHALETACQDQRAMQEYIYTMAKDGAMPESTAREIMRDNLSAYLDNEASPSYQIAQRILGSISEIYAHAEKYDTAPTAIFGSDYHNCLNQLNDYKEA